MQQKRRKGTAILAAIPVLAIPALAMAQTETIRVATYNIEDDIDGATTPLPGLYQVLEGIGEEDVQNDVQPLDILALQETTSNATTVAPIVTALNSFYSGTTTNSFTGASSVHPVYAMSGYQATEYSGDLANGNGPNALIYNTSALNLIASVGLGAATGPVSDGGNGVYRQVVRYEFQPVGDTGSNGIFYVYDSHYKSGTSSADATDRNGEAQVIRNDEAASLPANARVLYIGDYNTNASTDASYQTIAATNSPLGVNQGQGFDPINMPGNWATNPAFQGIMTESATELRYRDDLQMITQNVLDDAAGGLGYISGSYHAFGNNGTTPEGGRVNSGSDTALNTDLYEDGSSFITASQLYSYLTTASDHLPVVADYTVAVPEPGTIGLVFIGGAMLLRPRRPPARP